MFDFDYNTLILMTVLYLNTIIEVNTDKSNSEKITTVRENVVKHYGSNIASDVEAVKHSNWFFERYLQEYQFNEKAAEKAVIEAFDYFHKEKLHELNESYFPSEAYAIGAMFRFGKSKFGQPLVGVVMNHIRPFGLRLTKDSISKLTMKYSIFNIYKTLFAAKEKNYIVYIQFTNSTLENTEFSIFRQTMLLVNKYLPGTPMKMYIIGMNKFIEFSIKLLLNLLKPSLRQRLAFIGRAEEMEDLISPDEVPVHAGGRNKNLIRIPAGIKSGKCLPHLNYISGKDWDIFSDINIYAIQEGMRESNVKTVDQYLRGCPDSQSYKSIKSLRNRN